MDMDLEMTTRVLRRKDVDASSEPEVFFYSTPYITVSQHGYGRMDASTPARGLATSHVASCLAIVFHCRPTGRTVLSHSPNFLKMKTFAPIVHWVTGGTGEVDEEEWNIMQMQARHSYSTGDPCKVEVVVLRGFLYATPLATQYGHDEWMDDFRSFLSVIALLRDIRFNIVDSPRILSNGSVMVDKTTGRITCVVLHGSIRPRRVSHISIRHPDLPESESYSRAQVSQDLFISALLASQIPSEAAPISLQYDVSRYCLPMPLTDQARQLVRSKKEGEPAARQSAIILAFGVSEDWISRRRDHALVNSTFNSLLTQLPCERCGRLGLRKCSGCKGAWYCGVAHQREDWKAHKEWCKSHQVSK